MWQTSEAFFIFFSVFSLCSLSQILCVAPFSNWLILLSVHIYCCTHPLNFSFQLLYFSALEPPSGSFLQGPLPCFRQKTHSPSLSLLLTSCLFFGFYISPPTLYFLYKLVVLLLWVQNAWSYIDKTFHGLIKKLPFLDKATFKLLPTVSLWFLPHFPLWQLLTKALSKKNTFTSTTALSLLYWM